MKFVLYYPPTNHSTLSAPAPSVHTKSATNTHNAIVFVVMTRILPRKDDLHNDEHFDYLLDLPVQILSLEEQQKILAEIQHEQSLIEPSRQLIEIFSRKIQSRINDLWQQ